MWTCPRCETINQGETCIICGEPKPVEQPVAETPPQYTPPTSTSPYYTPPHEMPPEKPSGKNKPTALILILVIIVLVAGIGLGMAITNSDEDSDSGRRATHEPMTTSAVSPTQDSKLLKTAKPTSSPKKTPKPVSDETLIMETLERYAGCAATLDMAGALDCVKEGTDLYEDMESVGDMNIADMFVMGMQQTADIDDALAEDLADKLTPAMEHMLDKLKDNIEIEYERIRVDGNTATVEATLYMPDTNEVFSDDFSSAVMDELDYVDTEGMSDDKLVDVVAQAVENALDSIDVSDVSTQKTEATLELEKIGGKWLITVDG